MINGGLGIADCGYDPLAAQISTTNRYSYSSQSYAQTTAFNNLQIGLNNL